jgi:hypothetical protein
VAKLVAAIPESDWQTLRAQIAETVLSGRRLVVRRVRLVPAQGGRAYRD